jgi:hypothetical protein
MPQLPPPTPEDSHVQPGLQLQLVLDAKEAAAGDPVRAHVLKGGGIRRGGHVYGRVNRIINLDDLIPSPRPKHPPPTPKHELWQQHPGEAPIQIEFSQIEYRRSLAPLAARRFDLESQPGKRETEIRSFGYPDDDAAVRYDPPGAAISAWPTEFSTRFDHLLDLCLRERVLRGIQPVAQCGDRMPLPCNSKLHNSHFRIRV